MDDRVYGPRLFLALCRQSEIKKITIFLVGNDIALVKKKLKESYPHLQVDGYDFKHKKINSELFGDCMRKLTKSSVKLVFLGLGTPIQHEWLVKMNAFL